MWIFDKTVGFFSAVQDGQKPGNVLVRFRDPEHGKAFLRRMYHDLRCAPRLRETPGADYRWKVSVPHSFFAPFMQALASDIDYTNFKGKCSAPDSPPHVRAMHHNHHEVWAVMHCHQLGVVEAQRRAERLKANPQEAFDERELFDKAPPKAQAFARLMVERGIEFDAMTDEATKGGLA